MVVGIGLDRAVLMVSLLGQAEQKVRIDLSQPPGLIGLTPRKRMLWFPPYCRVMSFRYFAILVVSVLSRECVVFS